MLQPWLKDSVPQRTLNSKKKRIKRFSRERIKNQFFIERTPLKIKSLNLKWVFHGDATWEPFSALRGTFYRLLPVVARPTQRTSDQYKNILKRIKIVQHKKRFFKDQKWVSLHSVPQRTFNKRKRFSRERVMNQVFIWCTPRFFSVLQRTLYNKFFPEFSVNRNCPRVHSRCSI